MGKVQRCYFTQHVLIYLMSVSMSWIDHDAWGSDLHPGLNSVLWNTRLCIPLLFSWLHRCQSPEIESSCCVVEIHGNSISPCISVFHIICRCLLLVVVAPRRLVWGNIFDVLVCGRLWVRGGRELCCLPPPPWQRPAHYFTSALLGVRYTFLLMHAHAAWDNLTLVAMIAAVKAGLRCQCVSLTSPSGTPTLAHPCSTFLCVCVCVCVCVMMINTFVLKANGELMCVCICVCVCLLVSVSMCLPLCGDASCPHQ